MRGARWWGAMGWRVVGSGRMEKLTVHLSPSNYYTHHLVERIGRRIRKKTRHP